MKKLLFFFLLLCSCNGVQEPVTVNGPADETPTVLAGSQHMTSDSLGLSFDLPEGLGTCTTEEYDASKAPNTINDPGYTPKGFSLRIRCADYSFYLDAVSPDFTPYEGMWPLSAPESAEELVKIFWEESNFVHYPFLVNGATVEIFVMDNYWNGAAGESYFISAYIPTPTSSHYKVARFSLRLDTPPTYDDPNYTEKVRNYLQDIIERKSDSSGLEKVQAFEAILSSIKIF